MTHAVPNSESAAPTHRAEYRNDIDGLRAISVLAVIVFHFGYLPHGYLGVDVFFVISGYLITGIIRREQDEGKFSIVNFYIRRIRRILPLTTAAVIVALVIGIVVMLPDDLENLAQSAIATNFFSNNILLAITTGNYWDVVNEYKPLMHTWSLGVEEQFYFLYPLLIFAVGKRYKALFLPALGVLAAISCWLYLGPARDAEKFYFIQYRFWELACGGIAAIALKDRNFKDGRWLSLAATIFLGLLLCIDIPDLRPEVYLIGAVAAALVILTVGNQGNFLLNSQPLVGIGKISFSLYMWHQIFLAYDRYVWAQKLSLANLAVLSLLILAASIASYRWIEQPFRDKKRVSLKVLLTGLVILIALTSLGSYYIYLRAGILRDYPELGITKNEIQRNLHSKYNDRIKDYDRNFASSDKTKVLVLGDSFARDWANVLLESSSAKDLELSYMYVESNTPDLEQRAAEADLIFYSRPHPEVFKRLDLPLEKLWVIGEKNFGQNNGVFYNYRGPDYYEQRTPVDAKALENEANLRREWSPKFVSILDKVIDPDDKVPVFTPEHHFISQDCRHFTKFGAQYFAKLMDQEITELVQEAKKKGKEK